MARLLADQLSMHAARGAVLLDSVSLAAENATMIAIVGPNGAGKSSLLRALAGVHSTERTIFVDGQPVEKLSPEARARRLAWMPQALPPAWPVRVRDAVALGRYAFGASPDRLSATDQVAVDLALARCDLSALADRRITTLSGGELARVHLARLLATDADILLLDEPVAALDPAHRLHMMALLRVEADRGRTILVVLHDIGLAARWCDRIVALDHGHIVADGPPRDIVTTAFMRHLFAVDAEIHDIDGAPVPMIIRAAAPAAD